MYQVFEALGSGLVCLLWAILGDFPADFYTIPQAFKCLMNIMICIHQIKSCKLLSPTCIEALDKNPVKIQIRVLVSRDACHNQDGHAQ